MSLPLHHETHTSLPPKPTSPRGSEGPASFSTVVVAAALRSWKTWRVKLEISGASQTKTIQSLQIQLFAATLSYHKSLHVQNLSIVPNSTSTTCFWEVHHNFQQNMAAVNFLCQAGQTVVLQLGRWIWIWPTNRNLSSFKLGFPGWFPRLTNCNDIIHEVAIASTKLEGRIIQARAARCDESYPFTRCWKHLPRLHEVTVSDALSMSPTFGAAKAENLLSVSKKWGCFLGSVACQPFKKGD